MEFLRDDDIDQVEPVTETSNNKVIIDSGAEMESRLGDPAVELETPEAWPDQQDRSRKDQLRIIMRNRKEANGKRLIWLQVIGEFKAYFF